MGNPWAQTRIHTLPMSNQLPMGTTYGRPMGKEHDPYPTHLGWVPMGGQTHGLNCRLEAQHS